MGLWPLNMEPRKMTKELNTNEKAILNYITTYGDEFNDRPTLHKSEICPEGFTKNQVSGYISDLDKKGLIVECEFPNGQTGWQALT